MKYEPKYIIKFILEYDAGIPKTIIFAVVLSMCGVVVGLHLLRDDKLALARKTSWWFFLGYVIFVLCYTVVFRNCRATQIYFLRPLWSYTMLYYKKIAEIVLNVLMFMPIGFLYGGSKKKVRWVEVLCIGLGLSVVIEVMQLLTRRGVCSIDDVIHNTIGCLIGYGLFRLFYMMKPWLQCKLKTT
jgi:glycopeptide antibiotics resistance protein